MRRRTSRSVVAALAMLMAVGIPGLAAAGTSLPAQLRVNVFPGISNLALYAAQTRGFFARRGLDIHIQFTANSQDLREGLAKGAFEIAHAGVDNAIAMVELANADAIIVMGGDGGMNSLFVQPEIRSYADLHGKTVIVDAPNTAYALVLYKMLSLNGLDRGTYTVKPIGGTKLRLEAMLKDKGYAATMLNPPFSVLAEQGGLRNMGPAVRMLGAYQGSGMFVLRAWARANAEALIRYIQAYVEGPRWAMAPAHKTEATALVADQLKQSADVATKSYEIAADPMGGLTKDARLDIEGFKNTLKLRAEVEGQRSGSPPPAEKYFDRSYYDRAVAGL
ncbi:MAG TPA: ABC transporter substrate-binding protein [Candidatus Methylomirabilis sp.]|nr:ABC transporter substrate-binding protein [Candidatus Methylomirabilis sp.]